MKLLKWIFLIGFAVSFYIAKAQEAGIAFEKTGSWEEIKAKAKAEHKYIFVDCYATWCAPCKKMDQEVYPVDSVGKYANARFVSVKYQLDITKNDADDIKARYADARMIKAENKVAAMPTLLFYSPEGKLLHKVIGERDANGFVALLIDAQDTSKQYYTMLDRFHSGTLPFKVMPDLITASRWLMDTATTGEVSRAFVNNYLLKLPKEELYTTQNIGFLASLTNSTQDPGFKIFYQNPVLADTAAHKAGFSKTFCENLIWQESEKMLYVNGKRFEVNNNKAPDWNKLYKIIQTKYNEDYADRVSLWSKILWVEHRKDFKTYGGLVILKTQKYGPYDKFRPYARLDEHYRCNAVAWDLFQYAITKKQLEQALIWSNKAIKDSNGSDAGYLDTKANILYKLGHVNEALTLEAKASASLPNAKDIAESLAKMKKGEITWMEPGSRALIK